MAAVDHRVNVAWWALRIGLAIEQIIAGADKYFNKLTDWTMYLSPMATKMIPVEPARFMHVIGVAEIVLGLLLFTRWTKLGAYLVMLWLIGIVINLITAGAFYDLVVRDSEVAIAAFALAQLSAARSAATAKNAAIAA